jgi:integrase
MRLNEICSLHVRDIYQIDAIWVFDTQNHRIKNQSSRRIVPVHSQLIERGLLQFVEQQKNAGHFVLFPELQTGERMTSRDGLGEPVSKWFNRTLLHNIGVNKNLERDHHLLVDFHCTRTTVACKFKNRGVSSYQAKALLGHVEDDVTFGDYAGGENVGLDVLQRVIELLDY